MYSVTSLLNNKGFGTSFKSLTFNLSRFSLPFVFDNEKINKLEHMIDNAKENDIDLVFYFPPFSSECFAELERKDWWNAYLELQDYLDNLGVDVIRCIYPEKIGLEDRYMVDGFHPSEVLVGYQLLDYLKKGNVYSTYLKKIDIQNLNKELTAEKVIPISFMKDNFIN